MAQSVGYLVAATPSALRRADGASEVTLETYLHVREDALQLYGFADTGERALFVHLLGISGIGPKVALAVVSIPSKADDWPQWGGPRHDGVWRETGWKFDRWIDVVLMQLDLTPEGGPPPGEGLRL